MLINYILAIHITFKIISHQYRLVGNDVQNIKNLQIDFSNEIN